MKTKSKVEISVKVINENYEVIKEGNVYFFWPNLWKDNLINFISLFSHIKNIK